MNSSASESPSPQPDSHSVRIHEIQWTAAKSKRLWDYYASNPGYDDQYFGFQNGIGVVRLVQQEIDFKGVRQILDLSCGRGDLISAFLPLLRPDQQITGTDISVESIQICEKRFVGRRSQVNIELTPEFPTRFASGSFDLILVTEVIEHLQTHEIPPFFEEARRLLSPGGTLVVTTPCNEDMSKSKVLCPDCGCVFHRWQHQRSWSRSELQDCLESLGFQTRSCKEVYWSDYVQRNNLSWRDWLRRIARLLREPPAPNGLAYFGTPRS